MDIRTIYQQAALARRRVDQLRDGIRMGYKNIDQLKRHIRHDRRGTAWRLAVIGLPFTILNAPGLIHDYHHAHSLEQVIHDQQADIHHMEQQVSHDQQMARILEGLARSAEAGNTYALHQAEQLLQANHLPH